MPRGIRGVPGDPEDVAADRLAVALGFGDGRVHDRLPPGGRPRVEVEDPAVGLDAAADLAIIASTRRARP